ncbi:MAG: DUF302 domain-containing protein [Hydrogenothermaceae bacterium]
MKKLSLGIMFTGLISSYGVTTNDISFQTGYDKLQKSIKISRESIKNQTNLKSLSEAVADEKSEDKSDIYERYVNLTFEEVDLLLRTEIENANFKIIHVAYITKGVEEQGVKDFWKNMTLYLICKLSECYKVLKNNPQLLSQFPLRVYVYEKDGKMVIGAFKPSTIIKYMVNPDAEAIKALRELDREIKNIVDRIGK